MVTSPRVGGPSGVLLTSSQQCRMRAGMKGLGLRARAGELGGAERPSWEGGLLEMGTRGLCLWFRANKLLHSDRG